MRQVETQLRPKGREKKKKRLKGTKNAQVFAVAKEKKIAKDILFAIFLAIFFFFFGDKSPIKSFSQSMPPDLAQAPRPVQLALAVERPVVVGADPAARVGLGGARGHARARGGPGLPRSAWKKSRHTHTHTLINTLRKKKGGR